MSKNGGGMEKRKRGNRMCGGTRAAATIDERQKRFRLFFPLRQVRSQQIIKLDHSHCREGEA